MTTTLLIARHGNTFSPDDVLCRVGAGTDLPLVKSGLQQGSYLGLFLREKNMRLDHVFTSPLQRTQQTAKKALAALGQNISLTIDPRFNEIDYGSDEGMPETLVQQRLGQKTLQQWDQNAIVPSGWNVNPEKMIQDWQNFGKEMISSYKNQTVLVVTSNGTARFAPYLTGDFEHFKKNHHIKLATGAVCSLTYLDQEQKWQVNYWNIKPKNWLEDHNIDIL